MAVRRNFQEQITAQASASTASVTRIAALEAIVSNPTILAPVPTSDLGPEFTITVFYGVGVVSKTRLCEHGFASMGWRLPAINSPTG